MTTRRDLIKWLTGSAALALLPSRSVVADEPHDVLEGICRVDKALVDLHPTKEARQAYASEDLKAFEQVMRQMWAEKNGAARYVRVDKGWLLVSAHEWRDPETGEVKHVPESYEIFVQYRRA